MKKNNPVDIWADTFTHNVVCLRSRSMLSKKKMAVLLGIGVESLNKLERGEIPPRMTVEVLFHIESKFGISPADQFSRRLWEE